MNSWSNNLQVFFELNNISRSYFDEIRAEII